MKKAVLLLFVLSIFSLTSCKKDALDVSFNTNLSATSEQIDVNETVRNTMSGPDYNITFVLDLDNSETHDYLDKLKSIELSDVKLFFDGLAGLAGNTTVVDITITIDNDIVITIPNFSYDLVAQGDPIMISDMQKIKLIADKLLNRKKVNINISSSVPTTDPQHFHISFKAKAKIKAEAL